ncbi:hypothetical protein LPA71_09920 [Staphylococcus pseudintermedius]|uniref:hypothetical protein n=1 Tax=Staphylococcus pseudintermedius TaxID=283734 RepID=UPI001124514D|nr:hypothetical protein [Staphylococcus pseudintermedius]QKN86145.1 hypothetical protein pSpJ_40 [Staphylococcus virus pSp_SNUABM-J]QKN86217.1 hypothetical protein pSpS_38 [Staphylococcus virus pSp_SNUABM-S]EKI4599287.1 hypothetical protein [Staphylococcus pseudintermedius]MCE5574839.1 hypothetical protein [Staphylococcus pseudintermedius]TPD26096.1 hypothetical protein DJ449_02840 [Staphylococcus pseudintermedius]
MAEKLEIFTKEQEEKMKQNGIPRAIARSRVRRMGWTPERAVTTPIQEKRVSYTDFPKPPTPPKVAYMRFMDSRKDKSHLTKYPQYVKPSDYYNYLLNKVKWT